MDKKLYLRDNYSCSIEPNNATWQCQSTKFRWTKNYSFTILIIHAQISQTIHLYGAGHKVYMDKTLYLRDTDYSCLIKPNNEPSLCQNKKSMWTKIYISMVTNPEGQKCYLCKTNISSKMNV